MTNTAVDDGVDAAEPVGVAGAYHLSMVRTLDVFEMMTPYTLPVATTKRPAWAFTDHGVPVAVSVVADVAVAVPVYPAVTPLASAAACLSCPVLTLI